MGKWITVDSDALDGFRYDETGQMLRVRFHSGAVYDYLRVSPKLVNGLLNAPSKGHYFSKNIRDKVAFKRVTK